MTVTQAYRVGKVLQVVANVPDQKWVVNRVCKRGMESGSFGLMGIGGRGTSGRELNQTHTALELLPRTTTAILWAVYMDGGMEAVSERSGRLC